MDLSHRVFLWVFPVFLLASLAEAWILVRRRGQAYDWREAAASLAIAIGQRGVAALVGSALFGLYAGAWKLRLWTVPMDRASSVLLLFVATEFAYYWHHRIGHESRWFWATHAVHHSPEHLYLANADRLGWTGQATGSFIFYLPLVLLGFPPGWVLGALAFNLIYQFWLHTDLIGRLGWFDRVFNSPSNHRVHHSTHPRHLDRNYGGVLMIYDRLFGTYVAESEGERIVYGLVHPMTSYNPAWIALREWVLIGRDLRRARSLTEVLGFLFLAPGWQPGIPSLDRQLRQSEQSAQLTQLAQPEQSAQPEQPRLIHQAPQLQQRKIK